MDEARDARRRIVKEVWSTLERMRDEQKCHKAEADALMQRLEPLVEEAKMDSLLAEYIRMTQVRRCDSNERCFFLTFFSAGQIC